MSRYTVYIIPRAVHEVKDLPGHIKQRVKREIKAGTDEPRLASSKHLNISEFIHELRRIRLDRWRIVYSIVETEKTVDILSVRKRPPYDYGDLAILLEERE